MKNYLLSLFVGLALVLAACGESETEEKDFTMNDEPEDEEVNDEEQNANDSEDNDEEETQELDKVVVDDDNVKITMDTITKVEMPEFDEEHYEIKMEIENNLDETIEVQTREESADGKMIDEYAGMSKTVSGGKSADSELLIDTYGEEELPELNENLEFIVDVFSEDTFEPIDEYDVNVKFD